MPRIALEDQVVHREHGGAGQAREQMFRSVVKRGLRWVRQQTALVLCAACQPYLIDQWPIGKTGCLAREDAQAPTDLRLRQGKGRHWRKRRGELMAAVGVVEEGQRHPIRLPRPQMIGQPLSIARQACTLMHCRADVQENGESWHGCVVRVT